MSAEEFRRLEELKKQKDAQYNQIKGVFQGIRITGLNPAEETFLKLIELIVEGFRSSQTDLIFAYEQQLQISITVEGLEKRVEKLEEDWGNISEYK